MRWAASGEPGTWISTAEMCEQRKTDSAISRAGLSNTDLKTLPLLEQNNGQIAATLCLSVGTVKNHVTRMDTKIGVHTRIAVHQWAVEIGIG